jgi:hypothetical protein
MENTKIKKTVKTCPKESQKLLKGIHCHEAKFRHLYDKLYDATSQKIVILNTPHIGNLKPHFTFNHI